MRVHAAHQAAHHLEGMPRGGRLRPGEIGGHQGNDDEGAGHRQDDGGHEVRLQGDGHRHRGIAPDKIGSGHCRVVHAGHGQAHDPGAEQHGQGVPAGPGQDEAELDPQGQHGQAHRHRQGEHEEPQVVADEAVQAIGRHTQVMHGTDTAAQEQAAPEQLAAGQAGPADQGIGQGAGQDARDHGGQGDPRIVGGGAGQAEGQHADEMHGPDAAAEGQATQGDPGQAHRRPGARRHPLGDEQGPIGGENRHHHREGHQLEIVLPGIEQAAVRRRENEREGGDHRRKNDEAKPYGNSGQARRPTAYFQTRRRGGAGTGKKMTNGLSWCDAHRINHAANKAIVIE